MRGEALMSSCGTYRYTLTRTWGTSRDPIVAFVGLNPSTADAWKDDPTIRRCVRFAQKWGYGGLVMVNLFAYRATDPRAMKAVLDPVGPENDRWLRRVALECDVVAAWGTNGTFLYRDQVVMPLLGAVVDCLGITKDGQPRHPLYLPAATELQPYGLYNRVRNEWVPQCPHGDLCTGCDLAGACSRAAA